MWIPSTDGNDPRQACAGLCLPPDLAVIAATGLEAWAARHLLPNTNVARVGVALRDRTNHPAAPFVSCGLAGALAPALRPGTVIVPEWVGLPSGERLWCHPPHVAALVAAARRLGYEPATGPMLTADGLVTGLNRQKWHGRGFVAADMETGLLLQQHRHGAAVRVILDSFERDLSDGWEQPWRVLISPRLWPEAGRVAVAAPRYALRAAAVIREAMGAG